MNSATAIVLFYGLLAVATMILRGDLTDWPRWADRLASFGVALAAAVLLVKSGRLARPPAVSSTTPAKPSSNWRWWAAMTGFLAFVYLAALPPVSTWLAQPQQVQRSTDGRDASKSPTPSAPNPANPSPVSSPAAAGADVAGARASAAAGAAGSSLLDRLQSLWRQKPPWLSRLVLAAALLLMALIAWLLWRFLRPGKDQPVPAPGQQPLWFEEHHAPRYVREFARLCHRLGCPPGPGETFRDLLAGLTHAGHDVIELLPMTAYHYRVRYENASPDREAERSFSRMLRARRKASTSAPARGTTTAASATH